MRDEFEKLVASGKIGHKHLDKLLTLAEGGFCMHRSWGFGRITTVDTVFSRFTIDFQDKPGHSMDLAFAADLLKPIASDHVLARKFSDLNSLRQMAALNHLDLIKLVLQSFGGRATMEQIQQVLVPDVIAEDWKKWWEVAKMELKKDGHFQVPLKKTEPIIFLEEEISLQDRLQKQFTAAKGLKARISGAQEILKNIENLTDKEAAVRETVTALNMEIGTHERTQPALALEAIFMREDLLQAAGVSGAEGDRQAGDIWGQDLDLATFLEKLPAPKYRRALQSYSEACPNAWPQNLLNIINMVSMKLCSDCAHLLIQEGHLDLLKETLARLISQHGASSDLLLWLAKERSDAFADILGPEVFRAMLTSIERDQFNEKKSNKLRDFIIDDQNLLPELISSADIEVVRDMTRALKLSSSFDDVDRRSLLARIVKCYPSIQSLISGEPGKKDAGLIVSWSSLERRKKEYEDLVKKKIPANSKEIAIARSYGDLRENHEYKAAKEMQKILMRRKAELDTDLTRARGTDFVDARTEVVSIGTHVHATDPKSGRTETFTILGAWDSNPEKGVISYLTPVAQSMLNQPVGKEVEFELAGEKKRYRVDAIERAILEPEPETEPDPAPASEAVSPSAPVEPESTAPSAPEEPAASTPSTSTPPPTEPIAPDSGAQAAEKPAGSE